MRAVVKLTFVNYLGASQLECITCATYITRNVTANRNLEKVKTISFILW